MQTLSEIRRLLEERGLRPKHALGQNYLHDHNQLRKLVEAAGVTAGELVLEVGPGTGTLTETLLQAGARVVACELDRDMAGIVEDRNAAHLAAPGAPLGPGQLRVVRADCLDGKRGLAPALLQALREAGAPTFVLVANLPYQAATPLMALLLEQHPECRGQFVTIQREVADRLLADEGSDAYGPISVTMGLLARVELIGTVPAGCFWPAPKVVSAMVAVHPHAKRPAFEWAPFSAFVQRTFGQRRKQLGSILGRAEVAAAGFDPVRRPETLSPDEWVQLHRALVAT
jgi:16S rRNA (adenine1518-N6/adenine1519-N6)-dimethyltransferase